MPLEEEKVPTASFTFDKSEYISGQTIHLTNTSTNGDTFLWTRPDGKTDSTFNLDYLISPDDVGGNELFTLKATSAKKTKTSSFSASVIVKPMPASVISTYNGNSTSTFNPSASRVVDSISADKLSWIEAQAGIIQSNPFFSEFIKLTIFYFPNPSAPSTGSYSIVPNLSLCTPGNAFIRMTRQKGEDFDHYWSLSGVLEVSIDKGIVHAVFNQVPTVGDSQSVYPITNISGNIYSLL